MSRGSELAGLVLVALLFHPGRPLLAAEAGSPGEAARERGRVLDRHGHVVLHIPPLKRDAACAPELAEQVRRARPDAEPAAASIGTTLDGGLQALARRVVQLGVERLSREAATDAGPGPAEPIREGQIRTATVRHVRDEALELSLGDGDLVGVLPLPPPIDCEGHPMLPLAVPEVRFRAGERLLVQVERVERAAGRASRALLRLEPQAALVALSPHTRDVLALVGGHGLRPFDFDRATRARRQAGSTFKPLVYAAAMACAGHSPADRMEDLPRVYGGWRPRNNSGHFQGIISLRQAFAHSVNTVAVRLLSEVGVDRVARLARLLGLGDPPRDLTMALGTASVTPLELAAAFAVFGDTRDGSYLPPRLLEDAPRPVPMRVLPPQIAYLVSSLLGSVITEGSGSRARALGIPDLAGKTGTSSASRDAWFAGYHSELVAVVWVGQDAEARPPGPLPPARSGGDSALPLWTEFMRDALPLLDRQPARLPRPEGLLDVRRPDGGSELSLGKTGLSAVFCKLDGPSGR